jgi:outer membrane protein
MKNALKVLALVAMTSAPSLGQSLVGHLNVDSLLVEMPSYKQVMTDLQAEQAKFEAEAQEMQSELEKGAQTLQANAGTWTELRQRQEQQRLQEMYNAIQEYMQSAQQQLQALEIEKITPVLEELQSAIDSVAAEKKVAYVLDASQSKGMVIYSKGGLNLMSAVREKLGM